MENRKESLSKRQARREQIRRKERQQRLILLSVGGVALIIILAIIILPSIRNAQNSAQENAAANVFTPIAPGTYQNSNGATMGNSNAPVKIDVFEDFECPACKQYTESIEPDVIKNLVDTGKVYYIFHQYPFIDDNRPSKDSDRAANAATCAADQNRFWDFKRLLFANSSENPGVYPDARLKAMAASLNLDTNTFNACYDKNTHQDQITQDLTLGSQMGVSGTPSVFVNGKIVSPGSVPTYQQIADAVTAASGQ